MIDKLETYAPTNWHMLIHTHISMLCKENELDDRDINKYVQKYWDIVTTKLYKVFPGKYDIIPIQETGLAVNRLVDTMVNGVADLSSQITQVYSLTNQIAEMMQGHQEPVEKRISSAPIAINDTPGEWDIIPYKYYIKIKNNTNLGALLKNYKNLNIDIVVVIFNRECRC